MPPQNDPLAAAKAALSSAQGFTKSVSTVAPPASLTPGAGHTIGASFAAQHGADHEGKAPTGVIPELKVAADWRAQQIQQNPKELGYNK